MKTTLKDYEQWAREHCKRWNKKDTWEFYCLGKDTYLAGARKQREETLSVLFSLSENNLYTKEELLEIIGKVGQNEAEYEIGVPQIGANDNK